MKVPGLKKRESFDLSLVVTITIAFTLFYLSTNFIGGIYQCFSSYSSLSIGMGNFLLFDILFLWLIVTLWTTYRRWKEAVKKQEELEDIISSINADVLVVVDRDRNILMCNTPLKRVFGYEVDEVINQKVDLLYSDRSFDPSYRNERHNKLETDGFYIGSAVGEKKNGDRIPLEIITGYRSCQNGEVILLRDITERKRAEDETKHAYSELQQIFNTTGNGMCVIDKSFTILRINKAFSKFIEMDEEEARGKKCYSIFANSLCHSSNCPLIRILGGEKSVESDIEKDNKNGSKTPFIVMSTPFRDARGELVGIVEDFTDITERKRAEERDFLENIFKTSADGIMISDDKGHITKVNTALGKMLGCSSNEIIGKHGIELIPEEKKHQEKERKLSEIFLKKGIVRGFGHCWLRKDGSLIEVEINAAILKDKSGTITGSVANIREVTERKRLEKKLLQAEKLKSIGELSGGVAHDFNNVLTAILGRAELLKMNIESSPEWHERRKSVIALKKGLVIIAKAARDGAETVKRIQAFSRRRDDDKHFATIDLNEIIDNALEFTRTKWKNDVESKGIKINIQKEFSSIPPTSGNATELREVFTNLINNAIDAMPQGGHINIKTFTGNNHITIKVEDTGAGIPTDVRDRIFDPFFTTKGFQSSGLGMSVSYGIISRHRGTITADSVEGKGTTFTINLPILDKIAGEEEKAKPILKQQKKAIVLVIDDEEDVRELLFDVLTDSGHEVEIASDGFQGVEMFKKKSFDLVFTDLGMPGMSGWQVAEKIKAINDSVPIALITGWNVELNINKSEMKGNWIDFVVQKPFEMNQILKLVQEGMVLRNQIKAA